MQYLLLISAAVCLFGAFYGVSGQGGKSSRGVCNYGGKIYSKGEKFKQQCNTCKCKSGRVKCSQNRCGNVCTWTDCRKVRCPKINCRHGSHYRQGECCQICNEPTVLEEVCPPVTCKMFCQFGYKKNSKGCDICSCKENPCHVTDCPPSLPFCIVKGKEAVCQKCSNIMCMMFCEFGFKISADGCPICSCNPDPCSVKICPKKKPVCVVSDKKAVCQECSNVMCDLYCPYGFKSDDNGCATCSCSANPCKITLCPIDKPYCVVKGNKPVCQKCSPVECRMFCQYGFKKNSDGCPICSCEENPCKKKSCGCGEVCEVQKVTCVTTPCLPIAVCVDDPNQLPCARPQKSANGALIYCRLGLSIDCAPGFNCVGSSNGKCGVCCPLKQCQYNGKVYNNGDQFPSVDGCNKCSCQLDGIVLCTLKACPKKDCSHNGKTYKHGSNFPRGDGCNTCFCTDGVVGCTEAFCAHCKKDGILYPLGASVPGSWPCEHCRCVNDPDTDILDAKIICAIQGCPPPACQNPVTMPGQCCPVCKGCNPIMCTMFCEFGFKKDANGCDICSCADDPCKSKTCPVGQICKNVQCVKAPCDPICEACSPIMCTMFCEFGFKKDANGCDICSCADDPCKSKTCPVGQICKNVQCIKAPCDPICEDDPNKLPCSPVQTANGQQIFCGRGPSRQDCPLGSECVISPVDAYAVCCPKKDCVHNKITYKHGASFPRGDGCNTCRCSDGIVPCTKVYCPHCFYDGVYYAVGASYDATDGCNKCSCASNGKTLCTLMACPPCVHNKITYKSGSSFPRGDGCNTCTCRGGNVGCTKAYCPHCFYDGVYYAEGANFDATDGCNKCSCSNGNVACTLKACY